MFKWVMRIIPKFIKTWLTNLLYTDLASKGINGDTELVFLTSQQRYFLKSIGGAGTLNPDTKLKQYFGPLAVGLMVGTAAFGIAKLAGASTRTALLAGGLAGLGAGGLKALMAAPTATKVSAVQQGLANVGGTAGGTGAAVDAAALQASMGGGTASFMGGAGATGVGGITNPVMGPTLSGAPIGASVAPDFMLSQVTAKGLGGQGLSSAAALQKAALDIPTTAAYTGYDAAGNVVDITSPEVQAISRPGMDQAVGTVTPTPTSISEKVVNFVKENPITSGGIALTGAKILGDLTAQQPTYDDPTAPIPFNEQEYTDAYNRQRAAMQRFSERAPAPTMTADALTPANVYERQEEMFAAKQGGLATLKLKEGGVNYLPSKSDHDEKDANNYVRAMGYVEDGSGNGDKDEDTMLAQLADGEFVSRADAILGAGIMSGANPDDFKDMRRKGAQFFYKQQDSFKRVYDLVSDGNKAS